MLEPGLSLPQGSSREHSDPVMGTGGPWPGSGGTDGLGSWQLGRPTVCRHADGEEAASQGRGCPLPAGPAQPTGSSEQGAPRSHMHHVSVIGVEGGTGRGAL